MRFPLPQYIGGHFWWYGKQDFVPWTNPLWTIFNDAIRNNSRAEHIGGGPRLESNVSPTADPRDRGRISPSPRGSAT